MKFEEGIKNLENILAKLSEGDISLEESLELFSQGAALVGILSKQLEGAKLKIEELTADTANAKE